MLTLVDPEAVSMQASKAGTQLQLTVKGFYADNDICMYLLNHYPQKISLENNVGTGYMALKGLVFPFFDEALTIVVVHFSKGYDQPSRLIRILVYTVYSYS